MQLVCLAQKDVKTKTFENRIFSFSWDLWIRIDYVIKKEIYGFVEFLTFNYMRLIIWVDNDDVNLFSYFA